LGNLERDPVKEYQATMMAFRLRERLPDRERYLTEGNYYSFLNDWDQAALAYQKLLDLNPEDAWALNNSGVVASQLGQHEEALDYYRRAHAVEPTPTTVGNILIEEVSLGRYGDAEKSLQEFEAKFPGNWQIGRDRFWIAASKGEFEVAERLARARIETLKGSPFLHARSMGGLGMVLAVQGKLREAERYWRQGATLLDDAEISVRFYMMGNFPLGALFIREDPRAARVLVEQMNSPFLSDQIAPEQRPYLELIDLYAMVGAPAQARSLLAEYKRSVNPLVQKRQEVDLHRTMGVIALAEHRPQEAIQELSIHQERRAGSPHIDLPFIGRAYEESGLPDSAIAVYERYLTSHDVLRFLDDAWYLAGILVRLGDLYQERGDRNRAIEYYSRFVELWKNADPELQPRVRAVKSKLEALAGESRS
ncbi:MAG TPA: tetratricopeptide repeat protein, partial [Candidatus Eisenbacteria bacterium]|nr:tetratricopeptide repeat protein [Candidatus Eisenbacteria bacterium]